MAHRKTRFGSPFVLATCLCSPFVLNPAWAGTGHHPPATTESTTQTTTTTPTSTSATTATKGTTTEGTMDERKSRHVEARHVSRHLLQLGRQMRDPYALIAAARLLSATPPPRPLQTGAKVEGTRSLEAGQHVTTTTAQEVLQEARKLALSKPSPTQKETVALIDKLALTEVVTRGASMGPQQSCDLLAPNVKLTYNILYEGGEKAVVAISGDGKTDLLVTVTDEGGAPISQTLDQSLIAWYPRWRGVFGVTIENRSPRPVQFCMETN